MVEIGLPHPLLARGIALVDTPGVGGLNAAHAIATLAFLPSADALVFVTDASAELSAPELEFLARAQDAGPPIILVITKVDMHPAWRRIVELDAGHLKAAGIDLVAIPVSSVLHGIAERLGDETLAIESGLPSLHEAIASQATGGARTSAVAFALAEAVPAIEQLREPVETELHGARTTRPCRRAGDPAASGADAAGRARRRRCALVDPSRRRVRRAAITDRLRLPDEPPTARPRDPRRDRAHRPLAPWSELGQRLQSETATLVRSAFLATTDGAVTIQHTIAELLSDTDEGFEQATSPIRYDVTEAWRGGPEFGGRTQTGFLATMGLLGGAVVGVEMLGMLGTLAGAAIVGPAALGVALLFGGKQVVDERRRQLADRRQQARAFVSGFIEDVQFEVEGRLGDPARGPPAADARALRGAHPAAAAHERGGHGGARAGRRAGQPWSGASGSSGFARDLAVLDDLHARAAAADADAGRGRAGGRAPRSG